MHSHATSSTNGGSNGNGKIYGKREKCIHQLKLLDANVIFEHLVKRRFALARYVVFVLEAHVSHEMQRSTNTGRKNNHYNFSNNNTTPTSSTHQINVRQTGVGFERICKNTCTHVRYVVFGLEEHVSHEKRHNITPHLPQTHQSEHAQAVELV